MCNILHEKGFTQNVANVTFIFGTSPNAKPEEEKWGGHGILYPPHLKKRGDTSPVSPIKLRPWSNMKNSSHKTWQTSYLVLKPLQIQTLREKSGGTWHIMSPPSKKGGASPPCPPPNCAHDNAYAKTWFQLEEAWRILVFHGTSVSFSGKESHGCSYSFCYIAAAYLCDSGFQLFLLHNEKQK